MKETSRHCPHCGRLVPADAPAELCPSCLMRGGFSRDEPLVKSKSGSGSTLHLVIPDDAPLPAGAPQKLGSYEVLEKIAQGGMGIVYKARHSGLDRVVALKMIRSGLLANRLDVERFQREARSAAKLHHPNIVTIHDIGEQDGQHYYTMDYVPGENLAERARANPFTPRQAAEIAAGVAAAIHYAHERGVLHRDIKPANVILTPEQQPRVLDFGLALIVADDSTLTQTGTPVGSPPYMPPEQATGQTSRMDVRSDVYSLGALLYELLTGRAPFQAATTVEILQMVRENEPVSPRRLNPALPQDLETICLKCLEKDPERRYQTASELENDLKRFIRDEPILARPVSQTERLWRWCRRKPLVAGLSAMTLALLISVAIGTPVALYRINQARKEAVSQRGIAQDSARQASRLLYASDMNLAQQYVKLNDFGRACQLLDRHRPRLGEEDLRGWEWRYLWQLTRGSAPVTLTNRPNRGGFSTSFSPDGQRLAVGWWDGQVDLWDVPGRRWLRALTDGERPHPGRVAFSPVDNLLAATSEHMIVTLYDLDSGRESNLWRAPDQVEWIVRDLAFSQDGSRVVIYAGSNPECDDSVLVVNVSSSRIEGRYPAGCSRNRYDHFGAARLSPDNRRLYLARSDYLNYRYSIHCIDLITGEKLWELPWQTTARVLGLTAMDISADGRVLASASGFTGTDTTIQIWDAETGDHLKQIDGHDASVFDLAFTREGRHLISAGGDQTIRFWDTNAWTETRVLRGHTDEVWAIAVSEPAQLIASMSKDGDLSLWTKEGKRANESYRLLSETPAEYDAHLLDHSRVLLMPPGQPPELVDLKRDSPPVPLSELGASSNVLGCFGTNMLCLWNGTNQILVGELRDTEFVQREAMPLISGMPPTGVAYNPAHQLLAWTEGSFPTSLYLSSLAAPGRRIELRSDVPGLAPFRFSEDGNFVAATRQPDTLRIWNVESGQIVASINQRFSDACFAANGSVFVVTLHHRTIEEIAFYDLARPDRLPQRVPGGFFETRLAVSPNGGLVSASTLDGRVLLLDPTMGTLIETLHGQFPVAKHSAFSPDGRRLFSTYCCQEAVKLWDVGTRQELLTLAGLDASLSSGRWSADGNVILAGPPWQAWRAPSWEEIDRAERRGGGLGHTRMPPLVPPLGSRLNNQ